MHTFVNILSLSVAAAGWYYMFYSRAAHRLAALEASRSNVSRIRLRRGCGGLLALLGMLLFVGSQRQVEGRPVVFIVLWTGVMALLLVIVILAMIDLRLTLRIHRERQRPRIDVEADDR